MANLDPVEIEINLIQNVSGEADKAAAGIENLSTVSKASLEKLEKDFAAQVEVIKNMQFVIDELQKKIAEGSGDVISQESVDRLNEAQEVLTEVSNTVNAYQENMSAMTEANQQGADITQVFTEASQTLSENQTTLADTMGEILETHNELNEATEQNTESTDENTESMEHNTVANKLMSATIKGICDALGIENTAVVQSISNTRTITAVKIAWTRATQLLNTQLGISIGMSKALVASGIGLILVAVAAAVVAYRAWTQEDRILEKAQDSVNKTLEESAQKKRDLESQTQSYIGIVNSETKAINDQIAAYRQLQETFPKTLKNIDMQTFKLMGATQQQKLLNEAISQQANIDQDNYLEGLKVIRAVSSDRSDKNIISVFNKRWALDEAIDLGFEGFITSDEEALKILEKKIEILEQEKKKRQEIAAEAEFQMKPEGERRAILEAQLESLQAQKNALNANSGAVSGFNKETANGSVILQGVKDQATEVTGSVNKWTEQPNALSNIFTNASLQASILDAQIKGIQGQLNTLNGTGTSAVIKNEEFWSKRKKESEKFIKSLDSSVLSVLESGTGYAAIDPSIVSGYQKAVKEIAEAEKELAIYQPSKTLKAGAKGSSGKSPAEKEKERQQKATEDLAKKSLDIQAKIDAARVAAIEDGAAKQRAAIKAEYDKEKALIEQELKEISKLEKITGKPATEQRNQLDEYGTALDNQFAFDNKKLNEESAKQIKAIFDDVNQKFRGELENNLYAIKTYYDEQVKAAQKAGATLEQINTLNAARSKETAQAERQNQLQTLAFETDIAARRLALSKDFYVFESDRIRKQVELHKKAAQERLKILNDQYKESPTPELAQDIDEANVAISEMDKVIKKLSSQKFQEIAGYVSQIAGGLSELLGADSSAGVAMGWISEFADAGMKIASGDPKAMIEGTIQAALTIKDIIKTNAQANKEIREFAYELEQAAINYSIAIIAAMKDLKSVNDSLFYTDTNNSLIQGMEGYNAATQKEIELVSKLGDTTVAVGKKKKRFLGVTTGTKTIWESILTGYKKVLDTDDELIDKNGQVNKQIAESLLNSGKLSKEATNLINQILDAQDAAEAAMAQVESTLESLAGSIGDDLKTALIDAFQDGGAIGAAEKFKESVSKTLEDIVTDKMFSAIYGEMLGELEERMKGSYSMGGDEDLVDDIMWFYKQSQEGADKFYEQLAKAKEQLKQEGFDILSDAEREGASKGIATASQDSINELNGGVYALRQSVNTLVNLDKESILIQKTQSAALDRIADNSEHLKLLPAIKGQLEDLNNKGVTLRDR